MVNKQGFWHAAGSREDDPNVGDVVDWNDTVDYTGETQDTIVVTFGQADYAYVNTLGTNLIVGVDA